MTDITPELEAVAKAIYESDWPQSVSWERLKDLAANDGYIVSKQRRADAIKRARAALLAIREPTEGMRPHMYSGPIVDWQATIDHILGDAP